MPEFPFINFPLRDIYSLQNISSYVRVLSAVSHFPGGMTKFYVFHCSVKPSFLSWEGGKQVQHESHTEPLLQKHNAGCGGEVALNTSQARQL